MFLFQEQSSSTVSEEVRLDPMPAETSLDEELMVWLDVNNVHIIIFLF